MREPCSALIRGAQGGFSVSDSTGSLIEELADPEHAIAVAVTALTRLQDAPTYPEQACHLWRTLAVAEVVGFLEGELEDHYLNIGWARVVDRVITDELDYLSVARGFYFSWMAMRDLASAYLRFPHLRDRLAQTLSGTLESKIRRAKNEGWVVRDFRRHSSSPESALAAVYSKVMTRLDDDYLRLPPSLDHLRLL